jgi:hypothetical protein
VKTDCGEIPRIAQQCVHQLTDVSLGITVAQPGLPHHLLGVVGPPFRKGIADKNASEHRTGAIGVQEIEEVPGPDLVHAGEEQVGGTRKVGELLRSGPRGVGWSDVVDRGQPFLVRAGDVDVREVEPLIGRRLVH